MNIRTVYRLAVVLTKSQLRTYQQRRLISRIIGDPRTIIVADVLLLTCFAVLSHFIVSRLLPAEVQGSLWEIEERALSGIPLALSFAVILFGIIGEISQTVRSMSTDLVNWLPISPAEYVAGSTLSLCYTYSFLLSMFLGITLGPAVVFRLTDVWFVAAAMSTLALFMGGCVVELLRSLTNRISSSFYRKSGRSGIFIRLVLTILLLASFQLLFSGRIILYLLETVTETVRAVWFVPMVWPSLVVVYASQGNAAWGGVFGILATGLVLSFFGLAVISRSHFWVPVPVSIKMAQGAHAFEPRMTIPSFDIVESAIFRKDLRSLTRRREMARFLAIPFILAVSLTISLMPLRGIPASSGPGIIALVPLYLIPVLIFCAIMSMTSVGQEGYAIWNIYAAPVAPRQLLKPKMTLTLISGSAFSIAMLLFLSLFIELTDLYFVTMLVLGLTTVLETSAFGMYFAARFPDFRESVRSRFVTVFGSIIGTLGSIAIGIVTILPIIISMTRRSPPFKGAIALSLLLGAGMTIAAWILAERETKKLLRNIAI